MSKHLRPAVHASWLHTDTLPSVVSLTGNELQAAEGPNVGTGVLVPSPSLSLRDAHSAPVPTPSAVTS